uniref:Uncharacterized protein n=1 Tax=Candidatus Kentrum sp. LPFa TaxID=2126335 RepID=A0A450XXR0_9GAMM|nr:MAG: hypothetical protein BECKLPF1236C_GA0070990_102394 [Candidatus Kentron sp. LPFa]
MLLCFSFYRSAGFNGDQIGLSLLQRGLVLTIIDNDLQHLATAGRWEFDLGGIGENIDLHSLARHIQDSGPCLQGQRCILWLNFQ